MLVVDPRGMGVFSIAFALVIRAQAILAILLARARRAVLSVSLQSPSGRTPALIGGLRGSLIESRVGQIREWVIADEDVSWTSSDLLASQCRSFLR